MTTAWTTRILTNGSRRLVGRFLALVVASLFSVSAAAFGRPEPMPQTASVKAVGTIKAVSGNTVTLTPDSGPDLSVSVQEGAKLVLVAPGQTSLKEAVPIQISDLHPGDRILVRGIASADGKSLVAVSVIAMAKTEIAARQARERDEWQRHGVSGLVVSSDAASGNVIIDQSSLAGKKSLTVHVGKATVLRRYAPDSVKFDDARPAPFKAIKPGDQLRARGSRTPDGLEFAADEVVTGAFRNVAGTIISIDASAGTLTVQDLASKRPVTVVVSRDSEMRKLPQPLAQRIAVRLKGAPGGEKQAASDRPAEPRPATTFRQGANSGSTAGAAPGRPAGDLQQVLNRMPAISLADLQKGEAVMLVATEGSPKAGPSIVMLLAGVEPILQAAPGETNILSPWSLGAQGGEPSAP